MALAPTEERRARERAAHGGRQFPRDIGLFVVYFLNHVPPSPPPPHPAHTPRLLFLLSS